MKISQQTKTKAKFTFILLKVLEIGGVLGLTVGIYFLGRLFFYLKLDRITLIESPESVLGFWGIGLIFLLFIITYFVALVLVIKIIWWTLCGFIKINWKWAIVLSETGKEREQRLKEKGVIKSEKRSKIINISKEKLKQQRKEYGFGVGDKVRIKKNLKEGHKYGGEEFYSGMDKYRGEIKTVKKIKSDWDIILFDTGWTNWWSKEMLEPIRRRKK